MLGRAVLVVLAAASLLASAADVKGQNKFFGVPIFNGKKQAADGGAAATSEDGEDQTELAAFLTNLGFAKYASREFLDKLDDELAYDSIEDMTYILDDDEYAEVGMSKEDATTIHEAAQREMLRRFLAAVPVEAGMEPGGFVKHLDKLYAAGYEEPEDLEDIEEEEASELGLTLAEVKILASRAEEHEARELMTTMLVTYRDSDGTNPFKDEEVWRPMVEALVAAGCETLQDVGHLSSGEVTGLSDENLAKLQGDPRVLAHTRKQEL
jgi:hypothetical protein